MKRGIQILAAWLAMCPVFAFAEAPAVLFVLDASGSMWGRVEGKPKIEIARAVMSKSVRGLADHMQVGLVAYGHSRKDDCGDIELVNPIGSSKDELVSTVIGLNPKGQTPITDSLKFAIEKFKEREGAALVVLVSDGKESCGGDPCEAVRAAAAADINLRIHVVGFDVAKEEADQLRCIAKEGRGKYFSASSAGELTSALDEVQQEAVAVAAPTPAPTPAVKKVKLQVKQKGTFEFRWPGDEFWYVYKDETKVVSGRGTQKIELEPGSYTVRPAHGQTFDPFEITVRDGEVTTVQMGGFLEFRWPGDQFWEVYRGETVASSGSPLGTQKIALQAGTYTVEHHRSHGGRPFAPFEVTIRDGEVTTVEKGGFLEFRWPGNEFWDVYRGETLANAGNPRGTQKIALQAGTYTVEHHRGHAGRPFEPFQVTIRDGEVTTVELGGFLDFRLPVQTFWAAYRGETEAKQGNGTQKIALQAGTYTVRPKFDQAFEPFEVTIENGGTVLVEP